jgi:thioester reductase-like protein
MMINIYLNFFFNQLIRAKRDCLAEARLKSLLEAPIFTDIPASILAKVVAVQGDITLPGLGISQEVN